MRTVTKTHTLYEYHELTEKARQIVKEGYLSQMRRSVDFEYICIYDIRRMFPRSHLNIQFSLNGCQGDGLNIYGEIDVRDILSFVSSENRWDGYFKNSWEIMDPEDEREIKRYLGCCGAGVQLEMNRTRYTYCVADRISFSEDWIKRLEYDRFTDIRVDSIRKMERLVADIFTDLSAEFEKRGYRYLYEVDETEITGACMANGWEFYEDGRIWEDVNEEKR